MSRPLVSCIMPTYNRRRFVPRAIRYFLLQDYANKELIVVDDGNDVIRNLIPDDPNIQYLCLDRKKTIGAKRNLACQMARGDIIIHWDDDDWYAQHRISYQTGALLQNGAEVCGTNRLLFYDLRDRRAWKYVYPKGRRFWLSGNTLCYRRSFWENHPFEDVNVGEDGCFVWSGDPECMMALPDSTFHVGMIHANNASPKPNGGPCWKSCPVDEIARLLGADWQFYNPIRSDTVDSS